MASMAGHSQHGLYVVPSGCYLRVHGVCLADADLYAGTSSSRRSGSRGITLGSLKTARMLLCIAPTTAACRIPSGRRRSPADKQTLGWRYSGTM